MSDPERTKGLITKKNFEQDVVQGHISREEFEKIKDVTLHADLTVGDYVEIGLEYKKFVWNREERLVPNYSNATRRLSLDTDELSALRKKSIAEGEMPEDVLINIIRRGL